MRYQNDEEEEKNKTHKNNVNKGISNKNVIHNLFQDFPFTIYSSQSKGYNNFSCSSH